MTTMTVRTFPASESFESSQHVTRDSRNISTSALTLHPWLLHRDLDPARIKSVGAGSDFAPGVSEPKVLVLEQSSTIHRIAANLRPRSISRPDTDTGKDFP